MAKSTPPKYSKLLLERLCGEYSKHPIIGDLDEEFEQLSYEKGPRYASKWYRRQVVKSIPSFISHYSYWRSVMFLNYMKIALRNLVRHKSYSIINITGLAIGIAVSALILLYVVNELTYDRHIGNVKNKYRVCTRVNMQGDEFALAQAVAPLAPMLLQDYPEVVNAARTYSAFPFISHGEKVFNEELVFYADPGIFDMFSIEFIRGSATNAFDAPFALVITEEMADKYFGDGDPIGGVLTWNEKDKYTVTGIVKKLPDNTHFSFNMLASFATLYRIAIEGPSLDRWVGYNYKTYVELAEGRSAEQLEAKFPDLLAAHTDEMVAQLGLKVALFLQPLTSIHLHSDLEGDVPGGNITYITLFSAIAFFILLIACINFMNLSTARSRYRIKEVGVRKVMGAQRDKLIAQFLGESLLLSGFSLILALIAANAFLPIFNQLISKNLVFTLSQDWPLVLGLVILTLIVGTFAGSYPAFYLSSFQPLKMFTNTSHAGGGKLFRNALVNIQFVISIAMICCTGIIYSQLRFTKNKDLGFDKEQAVVIALQGENAKLHHEAFKSALLSIPGVINVAGSSTYPGKGTNETYFEFQGQGQVEGPVMPFMEVDYDYLATMKMEIIAGRNFSADFPGDNSALILNETLVKQLGWENPLGKTVDMTEIVGGKPEKIRYHVIGVTKDFHFASLHERIRPHLMKLTGEVNYITVRLHPDTISETMALLSGEWSKIAPSRPLNYVFLDEKFDLLYKSERKLGGLFIYFTSLAIFIACLGLFGLSSFAAEQRTKEIGIRKVLGASNVQVVLLLLKETLKWVMVANIIAWPIAYFSMTKWLQHFAYRIDLGITIFIISSVLALTIALITISFQSVRAARANPVDSLRYE